MQIRTPINTLLVLLAATATWATLDFADFRFGNEYSFFQSGSVQMSSILRHAVLIFAMLFGIVFGHLHNSFRTGGSYEAISYTEIRSLLKDRSLWRSLLASPIVFGVVYATSAKQPDAVIATLFAFENGFFCNLVLGERRRVAPAPEAGNEA